MKLTCVLFATALLMGCVPKSTIVSCEAPYYSGPALSAERGLGGQTVIYISFKESLTYPASVRCEIRETY
jgi:hypothetical protein